MLSALASAFAAVGTARRAVAQIIAYVDSPEFQHEALLRERAGIEHRLMELSHIG